MVKSELNDLCVFLRRAPPELTLKCADCMRFPFLPYVKLEGAHTVEVDKRRRKQAEAVVGLVQSNRYSVVATHSRVDSQRYRSRVASRPQRRPSYDNLAFVHVAREKGRRGRR